MYQPLANASINEQSAVDGGADCKFSMFGALSAAAANFAAANFASCPASTSASHYSAASGINMPASSVGSSCLQLGVPTKRERTKYTEYQLAYLESIFRTTNYPEGARREEIARQLQLTDVKVQVWFKNRRAKQRNERKFEQMKRETAAKIVAQRKESALAAVKRESVEDTEEEDQQSKVVKTTASSNGNIGKAKGAGNSGKAANRAVKPTPSSPAAVPPTQTEADQQESSLLSFYQLPKTVDSANCFSQWPNGGGQFTAGTMANGTTADMGSLMQMAAAFPGCAQSQSFYSGWTQSTANYSPLLPSTAYGTGQMFGQLANNATSMAAAYYQPGMAANYGGYYLPAQSAQPD